MSLEEKSLVDKFVSQVHGYTSSTLPIRLGMFKDEWYDQFGSEMPEKIQLFIQSRLITV